MPLLHQVVVPPQHRVRTYQEPETTQHLARQRCQERGEEGPILGGKLHPFRAELALKDRDLVA
ncbi:hypothetical protein [Streptomyces vastus]|uniref:hypothetical protein n=1 Tax=Streptomyces vastus TaxID=285451 RepID=UPI0031D2893E